MDITIIRIAGEILVTASILGIIYSVIRYLGVFIGDRKNIGRRKRYAHICLICTAMLAALFVISILLSLKSNNMQAI